MCRRIITISVFFVIFHNCNSQNFPGFLKNYDAYEYVFYKNDTNYIVKQNALEGLINKHGKILIPLAYNDLMDLSYAIPVIMSFDKEKNSYGLFTPAGIVLLETKYSSIYNPLLSTDVRVIGVETKDLTNSIYYLDSDGLKLLFEYSKDYWLTSFEHKYFDIVSQDEALFCFSKKDTKEVIKLFLLDKKHRWIDVTQKRRYYKFIETYYRNTSIEAETEVN